MTGGDTGAEAGRPPASGTRPETHKQRVDHELAELLQGFRVAVTGVQVLFAFLLTVPFSAGWAKATAVHHWLFYVALVTAAIASVAFIAPATQHRILFRAGNKESILHRSNQFGGVGSLATAASITAAIALVVGVIFAATLATATAAGISVLAVWAWLIDPLVRRARGVYSD